MSNKEKETTSSGLGLFGACVIVSIVFTALKLAGVISWPWLWILCPIWIYLVVVIALTLIILFVAIVLAVLEDK